MDGYRFKGKIDKEWHEFLVKTNDSLKISWHCLQRVAQRFPEMLEMTKDEFLALVKDGKPIYIFQNLDKPSRGIILKNGKLGFAVSFNSGKIITIFKYKPGRIKKVKLNPKIKKKSGYHRPSAKRQAQKETAQEL